MSYCIPIDCKEFPEFRYCYRNCSNFLIVNNEVKSKGATVLWIGKIISHVTLKITMVEYYSVEYEKQHWSVLTLSPSVLHFKAKHKARGLAQ